MYLNEFYCILIESDLNGLRNKQLIFLWNLFFENEKTKTESSVPLSGNNEPILFKIGDDF